MGDSLLLVCRPSLSSRQKEEDWGPIILGWDDAGTGFRKEWESHYSWFVSLISLSHRVYIGVSAMCRAQIVVDAVPGSGSLCMVLGRDLDHCAGCLRNNSKDSNFMWICRRKCIISGILTRSASAAVFLDRSKEGGVLSRLSGVLGYGLWGTGVARSRDGAYSHRTWMGPAV